MPTGLGPFLGGIEAGSLRAPKIPKNGVDNAVTTVHPANMSERTKGWRQRRLDAGLSLRRLSVLSGVNRGTISRIERGFAASPEDTIAIARALDSAKGGQA